MSPDAKTSPSAKLLNRDFLLLWQGQFVSQAGSQAFLIAMMYWTMEASGSATLMGLLLTLSTLPGVVLGPLAGTFVDRHSRKNTIVVSDILSGLCVLGVAALHFQGVGPRVLIAALLVASGLIGAIQAFFRPAITAAIPDIVSTERLQGANSLYMLSGQLSTILGQGAGGLIYATLGAPVLFLIDGVSYLFSAASEIVHPHSAKGWCHLAARYCVNSGELR